MALERTVEFREEVLASETWRSEGCCSVEREQSRCDEDGLQELERAQSSGHEMALVEEGHVDHDDGSCWRQLQGAGGGVWGTGLCTAG